MGLAILTALMSCQTYPNVCIVQGQTYWQIFTAEGDWSGAVCRGQIRDNWLGSDGTIKAVFEFGSLTYDAETDLTTVEGVVSHQQTTLLPATKYQGVGLQSVKNSLVYDVEFELGDNVFKLAPGYVQVIPEVSDDSIIYDPPVIWDGGINSIELTETTGLIDTYTVWGDVDKTINLGTFDVKNSEGVGIESANYDNSTGVLTFTYTDSSEFQTGDIRGERGNAGVGIQSTEYDPLTGILTFTFTDNSEFTTGDLRADLDAATIKTRYESNDDTNAFTDAEKTKLSGLNVTDYATAAQGALAETALQPDDVDLSPYALSSDVSLALDNKVDKATGKGLSTEDYTSEEKTKLSQLSPIESLIIAVSDETSNLSVGINKITFRMPYALTLTGIRASVNTAPVGSILIVDVNQNGASILGVKLSIDATEKTSVTAATPATITTSALLDDAEITIDIDQVGATTAGKGLKVTFLGVRA